jgi:hypothetical protein
VRKLLFIILLLLVYTNGYCVDPTKIFLIGDSVTEIAYTDYLQANQPIAGYTITAPVFILDEYTYYGAHIYNWSKPVGTVPPCDDFNYWGCIDADAGVLWVYSLGMNDVVSFNNGHYANLTAISTALLQFFSDLHSTFPNARIIWGTTYPWDVDGFNAGAESCLFSGAGAVLPPVDPGASGLTWLNGSWAKFLGIVLPQIPAYVTVIDTWRQITYQNSADVDSWCDSYLVNDDRICAHVSGNKVQLYYTNYILPYIGQALVPAQIKGGGVSGGKIGY